MKKTLSILMLLMMLSFMFAQGEENIEVIQDSLAIAGTDSAILSSNSKAVNTSSTE